MPGLEEMAGAMSSKLIDSAGGGVTGILGQWTSALFPFAVPSPEILFELLRRGFISPDDCAKYCRKSGVVFSGDTEHPVGYHGPVNKENAKIWQATYDSGIVLPSPGEMFSLVNRGLLDKGDLDDYLLWQGWEFDWLRNAYAQLRYELPGIADLVRFAVRHVWEPDLIAKFGYNDEYRSAVGWWMGKQGFDYDMRTPDEKTSGRTPYTPGQAHWWSHWVLPSPGQGYEMLQRLRPGRVDPAVQLSRDDLKLLLRANDYPPYWRDRLIEISYRPIGLRQLQQMLQAGLFLDQQGNPDLGEIGERWQDLGYKPDDAKTLAQLLANRVAQTRWKAATTGARSKVLDAYTVGTMDRDTATVELYLFSLADPNVIRSVQALPQAEQVSKASSDVGIKMELDAIDAGIYATQAKQAVSSIQRRYVSGILDENGARTQLTYLGIVPPRITQYLDLWRLQFSQPKKELAATKVLQYFRLGIISQVQAFKRLQRMGWQDEDAQLMLAEAERNIALDQAKAEMQQAKTIKQQQQAAEKAVKAAQAEHNQARAELARHGNPGQLTQWVIRGLITPAEMFQRLLLLDWPAADAETATLDAVDKRKDRGRTVQLQALADVKRTIEGADTVAGLLAIQEQKAASKLPIADLKAMLKDGIESPEDARAELAERGWPIEAIDEWMAQYGP